MENHAGLYSNLYACSCKNMWQIMQKQKQIRPRKCLFSMWAIPESSNLLLSRDKFEISEWVMKRIIKGFIEEKGSSRSKGYFLLLIIKNLMF